MAGPVVVPLDEHVERLTAEGLIGMRAAAALYGRLLGAGAPVGRARASLRTLRLG